MVKPLTEEQRIELEMEAHQFLWKSCQELAAELVLGRGWKKSDEDFRYQVEEEADRLWDEEMERELFRKGIHEEMLMEEESQKSPSLGLGPSTGG